MTEQEWLETTDGRALHDWFGTTDEADFYKFVKAMGSERKNGLLDAECDRLVATLPPMPGRTYQDVLNVFAGQFAAAHDIFGLSFFRPTIVDPIWLTSTVVSLAQAIYEERAFDRLPILADALEDAGCTNVELLNHCRQPGEHVRGCWLVDLILGRR